MPRFAPPAPAPLVGHDLKSQSMGRTQMSSETMQWLALAICGALRVCLRMFITWLVPVGIP
jgi:hypothetical protein